MHVQVTIREGYIQVLFSRFCFVDVVNLGNEYFQILFYVLSSKFYFTC